jgi:hypothetical protein
MPLCNTDFYITFNIIKMQTNFLKSPKLNFFKAPFPNNSSYFLKYLHVVHKGGAGTGAAAWNGSDSRKMMLLWLRFGRLQLTLFINMLKLREITISESRVAEPLSRKFSDLDAHSVGS